MLLNIKLLFIQNRSKRPCVTCVVVRKKKNTKIFRNFKEIINFSLFFIVISVEFEALSS